MTESIKNNNRELLFADIIKIIERTLNINETKTTITEVICKSLGADRCFIVDYDKKADKFLPIKHEYLASQKIPSCIGEDVQKIVPNLIDIVKNGKHILVKNRKVFSDNNELDLEPEEKTFEKFDINSILAMPLFYQKELLGVLSIHYIDKIHQIDDSEINLIKEIANQTVLAIYLANLYELNQAQAEKAQLLRKIIEYSRKSLILEDVLLDICKGIAELFKIQRVTIGKISEDLTNKDLIDVEYTYAKNTPLPKNNDEIQEYWKNYLLQGGQLKRIKNIEESDLPENIVKIYKKMGVKSILCIPLEEDNSRWGGLFLSEYNYYRECTDENVEFWETVAAQIYIAIRQAELYEKEKKAVERETLLRNLIEVIRSTIDIDEMQKTIVKKIAETLNADRCFIMDYDEDTEGFLPVKTEYLLSPETTKSILGFNLSKEVPQLAENNKRNIDVTITNLDKYLIENNYYNTAVEKHFRKYELKSGFSISISYMNQLLGVLAIHYLHKQGNFIEKELEFVKALANQIGIALNQAKLYKKEELAIEREKMSRNIIEILRQSLDKTMIKKLFVKNIRKFLDADKVYFSEYDAETQTFLPIEKDAEALSNYKEKSFVGYNLEKQEFSEYIQPLKEKQELNIFNWDKYIQENIKAKDFIDFFETANIKSSYNLPVLYYQNIIGFLSINFTDNAKILSTEDIDKLRDLCTQLGIALYQARLFLDARQCFFSKEALLEKVSQKIEPPIKNILYESTHLSKNEIERESQIKNITDSCDLILNSTKDFYDGI